MVGFLIEPDGAGRLAASGELDFSTAAAALEAGLRLIRPGERFTIDLGGITAGDSAGLAVLVEWISAAQARGATIAYERVPAQILAIARISELDGLLTHQPA
jgi:phospholipid transport system transporter-binding protein